VLPFGGEKLRRTFSFFHLTSRREREIIGLIIKLTVEAFWIVFIF